MKITKPAEEIEVCDFCSTGGYLQKCTVCGQQFCFHCEGSVMCSWGFFHLCEECVQREDVQKTIGRYTRQLTPIYEKRTKALKRLKRIHK